MMTKEEAIKNLKMQRDLFKFNPTTGEEESWRYPDEIEALDMAIGSLEGNTSFMKVTFDRDQLQELVEEAKKEIQMEIKALKQEPPKATWEGVEYDGYAGGWPVYDVWECTQCGYEHHGESDTLTDYCPGCGAKMTESEE